MAESDSLTATTADTAGGLVDQAAEATAGTRRAALWIASALGAIPSLAVLGSLVRAPGDAGYDATQLVLGIMFCALGALVGILAFATVITPVRLEDSQLADFNMARIPGAVDDSFDRLNTAIAWFRVVMSTRQDQIYAAEEDSASAQAAASLADARAKVAEAEAAAEDDADKKAEARVARSAADDARGRADVAAGRVAALSVAARQWAAELAERERLRNETYKLKASDEVADRFDDAKVAGAAAVVVVAIGVSLLAVAPNSGVTESTSPPTPSIVRLHLNATGRDQLNCPNDYRLDGLRIGGTDASPLIVTFPTETCPAQYISDAIAGSRGITSIGTVESIATPTAAPETPS